MTEDGMSLVELVEKYGGADFPREVGEWTLQRLMELEARQRCGAGPHERSPERTNQRNGYRDRRLETRLGALGLKMPKLRSGSYFPSFLQPRKSSEQAGDERNLQEPGLEAVLRSTNGCRASSNVS